MDQTTQGRDGLRARAVELRSGGWSVPDIAREVGVARSTAWLWVRDQPLDPEATAPGPAAADRRTAAVREWWSGRLAATDADRQAAHTAATEPVRGLTDVDLLKSARSCTGSTSGKAGSTTG